jgi:glycerol uptake facilitator-like aquaporin
MKRLQDRSDRSRALLAEGLGSLLLAATVIGSGVMAEHLAAGNVAIALLANTGATVAVLAVLIRLTDVPAFIGAQVIGALCAALIARVLFAKHASVARDLLAAEDRTSPATSGVPQ